MKKAIVQLKNEFNFSLDSIRQGFTKTIADNMKQSPILERILEKIPDTLFENDKIDGNGKI